MLSLMLCVVFTFTTIAPSAPAKEESAAAEKTENKPYQYVPSYPLNLAIKALSADDPIEAFAEAIGTEITLSQETMDTLAAQGKLEELNEYADQVVTKINQLLAGIPDNRVRIQLDKKEREFIITLLPEGETGEPLASRDDLIAKISHGDIDRIVARASVDPTRANEGLPQFEVNDFWVAPVMPKIERKIKRQRNAHTNETGSSEQFIFEVHPGEMDLDVSVVEEFHDLFHWDHETQTVIFNPLRRSMEPEKWRPFYNRETWNFADADGEHRGHFTEFQKQNPTKEILASVANGNVFMNENFVAYKGGKLYRAWKEEFEAKVYTSLVRWNDGRISAEILKYERDAKGQLLVYQSDEQGTKLADITNDIYFATYGQQVARNGAMRPIFDYFNQIEDVNHLLAFPVVRTAAGRTIARFGLKDLFRNRQLVQRALEGEFVTIEFSEKHRRKLKLAVKFISQNDVRTSLKAGGYEEGKDFFFPGKDKVAIKIRRSRMQHNLIGIKKDGTLIVSVINSERHGYGETPESAAAELVKRGAQDVFLLANGADQRLYYGGQMISESSRPDRVGMPSTLIFSKKKNLVQYQDVMSKTKLTRLNNAFARYGKLQKSNPELCNPLDADIVIRKGGVHYARRIGDENVVELYDRLLTRKDGDSMNDIINRIVFALRHEADEGIYDNHEDIINRDVAFLQTLSPHEVTQLLSASGFEPYRYYFKEADITMEAEAAEPKIAKRDIEEGYIVYSMLKADVKADPSQNSNRQGKPFSRADIIRDIEEAGFEVILQGTPRVLTEDEAREFYIELQHQEWFESFIERMRSDEVIPLVLRKRNTNAVRSFRGLIGPTNSQGPGTLRYIYGGGVRWNRIHGADSVKSVLREIDIILSAEEKKSIFTDEALTFFDEIKADDFDGVYPPKKEILNLVTMLRTAPLEDQLSEFLRNEIVRVFPEFNKMDEYRPGKADHTYQVINYLLHLIKGDFDFFYKNLKLSEEKELAWQEKKWDVKYREQLNKIKELFDAMEDHEQEAVIFLAVIHDLGYSQPNLRKISHHITQGGATVYNMLTGRGFSHEEAIYWRKMLIHHADVGMMGAGETTARFHTELTPKERDMALIIATCDVAGWIQLTGSVADGAFTARNKLNLATVTNFLNRHASIEEIVQSGDFYQTRLKKLVRRKIKRKLSPEEIKRLDGAVATLLQPQDRPIFKQMLSENVYLYDKPLFLSAVDPNDFTRFIKLCKLAAFAAYQKIGTKTAFQTFYIDNDIDLSDTSRTATYRDLTVFFERLDAIPDDFSYDDFASSISETESFIFDIPVYYDDTMLLFVLDNKNRITDRSMDTKQQIKRLIEELKAAPLEDTLPLTLQEEIARVFPEFARINRRRLGKGAHVNQVVNNLLHLIAGDVDYFYNNLQLRPDTEKKWQEKGWDTEYKGKLLSVRDMFNSFLPEKQDDIIFFAVIHDMGYDSDDELKPPYHVSKGDDIIYDILVQRNFTHDEAVYWGKMLAHHADVGMMGSAELTPHFHAQLPQDERNMCFILAMCDVAAWVNLYGDLGQPTIEQKNILTLATFDRFFNRHVSLENLMAKGEFYYTRLKKMGRGSFRGVLPAQDREVLNNEIARQIQSQDMVIFKKMLNENIYIVDPAFFFATVDKTNFTWYLKLWKLAAFAAYHRVSKAKEFKTFYVDADIDLYDPARAKDDPRLLLFFSQLDAIPDTFTYADFLNNITDDEKLVYDIPVSYKDNELKFMLTFDAPKVITISGPPAAGKSTIARNIAQKINAVNISVGMLYRGLAYLGMQEDDFSEERLLALLEDVTIRNDQFYNPIIRYQEADITAEVATRRKEIEAVMSGEEKYLTRAIHARIVDIWQTTVLDTQRKSKHVVIDARPPAIKKYLPDMARIDFLIHASLDERVRRTIERLKSDNDVDEAGVYQILFNTEPPMDIREDREQLGRLIAEQARKNLLERERSEVLMQQRIPGMFIIDTDGITIEDVTGQVEAAVIYHAEIEELNTYFGVAVDEATVKKFFDDKRTFVFDEIKHWTPEEIQTAVARWGLKFDRFINTQRLLRDEKAWRSYRFINFVYSYIYSLLGEEGLRRQRLVAMLQEDGLFNTEGKTWVQIEQAVMQLLYETPPAVLSDKDFAALFHDDYIPGASQLYQRTTAEFNAKYSEKFRERLVNRYEQRGLLKKDKQAVLKRLAEYHEAMQQYYRHSTKSKLLGDMTVQESHAGMLRIVHPIAIGQPAMVISPDLNIKGNNAAMKVARTILLPLLGRMQSTTDSDLGENARTIFKMIARAQTAFFVQSNINPYDAAQLDMIASDILADAEGLRLGLDSVNEYLEEHLINQPKKTVAWFPDDNGGVVFSLLWIQKQLELNPNLKIVLVPKDGQYDVSASFHDIELLLSFDEGQQEPLFQNLRDLITEGRFVVFQEGPRLPGFNGREISPELATLLRHEIDSIVSMGPSLMESLTGIKKDIYSGLDVLYPLSVKLVGTERLVFYKVPAGAPAFQDVNSTVHGSFEVEDAVTAASYRDYYAGQTVQDFVEAIHSPNYRKIFSHLNKYTNMEVDRVWVNTWIKAQAALHGVTFAQFIMAFDQFSPFGIADSIGARFAMEQEKRTQRYVFIAGSVAESLEAGLEGQGVVDERKMHHFMSLLGIDRAVKVFVHSDQAQTFPLLEKYITLVKTGIEKSFAEAAEDIRVEMYDQALNPADLRLIAGAFDAETVQGGGLFFSITDENDSLLPGAVEIVLPIAFQFERVDIRMLRGDNNLFYPNGYIMKLNQDFIMSFQFLISSPVLSHFAQQVVAAVTRHVSERQVRIAA